VNDESYHQRVKEEKRLAAVRAATDLFLEQGYERTSLQQVAKRADLSTATLFKRYPTKAALFSAIVEEFWTVDNRCGRTTPIGNPRQGLTKIGLDYARRMRQREMVALYRLIVSEALRFPDLGRTLYDRGKGPYLELLEQYLAAERDAGSLHIENIPMAARAFLATIAGQVFWPELVAPGCGGSDEETQTVVAHAVEMALTKQAG
jgi:TetR/AcrR family transcriptional regulator, regulator of autoinduction and epiphytic fitness